MQIRIKFKSIIIFAWLQAGGYLTEVSAKQVWQYINISYTTPDLPVFKTEKGLKKISLSIYFNESDV